MHTPEPLHPEEPLHPKLTPIRFRTKPTNIRKSKSPSSPKPLTEVVEDLKRENTQLVNFWRGVAGEIEDLNAKVRA